MGMLITLTAIALAIWALRRVALLEERVAILSERLTRLNRTVQPPDSEPPEVMAPEVMAPAEIPIPEVEPRRSRPVPLAPPSPKTPAPEMPTVGAPVRPTAPPTPAAAAPAQPVVPPVAPLAPEAPPVSRPPDTPLVPQPLPAAPPPHLGGVSSLEATVGGKWALWVGVILILCAAAFGLAYGWSYVGPGGRVACGVVLGLIFLGLSDWFRPRTQEWYVEGLAGAGVSLLYLSIWAAAMRYHLLGTPSAFAAMALVTGLGVLLALRQDASSLLVLSTIGGFLTPAILQGSGGGTSDALIFWIYVTILNAGVIGAASHKGWRPVWVISLLGSVLLIGGWLATGYDESLRWASLAFLAVNLLLFVGATVRGCLTTGEETGAVELTILFVATTGFFLAGVYVLPSSPSLCRGLLALGLGAGELLLGWGARRRAEEPSLLPDAAFGLGGALMVLACPLLLSGNPLTVAWAAEAVVLTHLGIRYRRETVSTAGWLVLAASVVVLLAMDLQSHRTQQVLLLNARGATFIVVFSACCSMAWLRLRSAGGEVAGNRVHAGALLTVAGGLLLWLSAREVHDAFIVHDWAAPLTGTAAWLLTLAVWAVLALVWYRLGEALELTGPRVLGQVLLILATVLLGLLSGATLSQRWLPVLNLRALTGLVVVGCDLSLAYRRRRATGDAGDGVSETTAVLAALLALTIGSQEIYAGLPVAAFGSPQSRQAGVWLTFAAVWALYSALLLHVGTRAHSTALRWLGTVLWLLAAVLTLSLCFSPGTREWAPYLNVRGAAFVALLSSLAAMAGAVAAAREEVTEDERLVLGPDVVVAVGAVLGLVELGLETWEAFAWSQFPSPQMWRHAAQLGVSVVWTLYAAAWLAAGVARRHALSRWFALGLFGVALLKVFLLDLQFLSLPYRMVSFGVLGGILVAVAWLYAQFGERLLADWAGDDEQRPST